MMPGAYLLRHVRAAPCRTHAAATPKTDTGIRRSGTGIQVFFPNTF